MKGPDRTQKTHGRGRSSEGEPRGFPSQSDRRALPSEDEANSTEDEANPTEDEAYLVPIEDSIDLHAFRPEDIPDVVRDYLEEAAARGFGEVRLIHGKGIGFQRQRVRQVLESHPRVESFGDAPAERGHWGATIVRLRAPGRDQTPPGTQD